MRLFDKKNSIFSLQKFIIITKQIRTNFYQFCMKILDLNKDQMYYKFKKLLENYMEKEHHQIREILNPPAQNISGKSTEQQPLNPQTIRFLKKLEGQCRIVQYTFLQISYLKIAIFVVPIILSVVGLVLLFHYKKLRALAFYHNLRPKNSKLSSHIYVQSADGLDQICKIKKIKGKAKQQWIFKFEELTYQICNNEPLPLGIKLQEQIGEHLNIQFLQKGLSEQQIVNKTAIYGKNEHLVKTPPYQKFLIYNLLHPMMIIQYITCVLYFFEGLGLYSYLLVGSSLLTIHINYFLMRKSYNKIRKIAEKTFTVKVLREGTMKVINNADLVPGDLYFPDRQIPCDSIILTKDIFVNQVGFTGQNIPIGKFALTSIQKLYDSQNWVYQGSEVVSRKQNTMAMAVTTGYSNRKGQIIRKILNKSPSSNQFFKNIIWLAIQVLIASFVLYGICYSYMFHEDIINRKFIYLRIVDFIINSVPAVLQMFINLLYTINLIRLNAKGIIGTDAEKTIEGSRLQTLCFDKTGTLTENSMDIEEVILLKEKERKKISIDDVKDYGIIHRLFSSCHTVQVINDDIHGDEIDIKMFTTANSKLKTSNNDKVIYEIIGQSFELQVWKIHQFQSKFQSMSVLVREKKNGSMYVFVKGSPQMIHNCSVMKHENFGSLVKELSLDGYRTIALGFKEIQNQQQFEQYLNLDRERYMQGITLIGLATFTNKLKIDAKQLIETLHQAQIKVKLITGDNIFVAVQNALVLHLVPESQRIIVLQGIKVNQDGSMKAIAVKTIKGGIFEEQIFIQNVDQYSWEDQYLAMDLQFINTKEQIFLKHDCVVFARATPQMKRIIIKKEKEKLKASFNNRTWKDRTFGGRLKKIGMVGDGANDLMALNQANIGIGISNSDAIYSADFTIQNLKQIDTILRQSKCAERKLIEMTNFNNILHGLNVIFFIFWTPEATIISSIPELIRNFTCFYPITILIGLTPPAEKITKYIPSSNMIGLQNQLIYWGVWIINSAGLAVAYLNYKSSNDFQHNPDRSQINPMTKTSTVIFLVGVFLSAFLPVSLSQSYPWKLRIWKNVSLFIIIVFDLVFVTVVLFNTKYFGSLEITQIEIGAALQLYLIAVSTVALSIAYTTIIQQFKLYRNQYQFVKAKPNIKLKQLTHSIG